MMSVAVKGLINIIIFYFFMLKKLKGRKLVKHNIIIRYIYQQDTLSIAMYYVSLPIV